MKKIIVRNSHDLVAKRFLNEILNNAGDNIIKEELLQEALMQFVTNAFNTAKAEIDKLKTMAVDAVISFVKQSVQKIIDTLTALNSKGFLSLKTFRVLKVELQVLLIPKHAKFLGSIVIGILKQLVTSGLQAVIPAALASSYQNMQNNAEKLNQIIGAIKNFAGGLGQTLAYIKDQVLEGGKEALMNFCSTFLGIDAKEFAAYIPDVASLIQDLKNPLGAVKQEFGLKALLEERELMRWKILSNI